MFDEKCLRDELQYIWDYSKKTGFSLQNSLIILKKEIEVKVVHI